MYLIAMYICHFTKYLIIKHTITVCSCYDLNLVCFKSVMLNKKDFRASLSISISSTYQEKCCHNIQNDDTLFNFIGKKIGKF